MKYLYIRYSMIQELGRTQRNLVEPTGTTWWNLAETGGNRYNPVGLGRVSGLLKWYGLGLGSLKICSGPLQVQKICSGQPWVQLFL